MSDLKLKMEAFLAAARAAYEEAKINYNTGKCTIGQLDNVRLSLEKLERAAASLPSTNRERGNRFCKHDDCPYPDCLVEGGVCPSQPPAERGSPL